MTPPVRFETVEGKTFYIFPEHVMAIVDGRDPNNPEIPQTQIVLTSSLTYHYRDTAPNTMRKLMGMGQ